MEPLISKFCLYTKFSSLVEKLQKTQIYRAFSAVNKLNLDFQQGKEDAGLSESTAVYSPWIAA